MKTSFIGLFLILIICTTGHSQSSKLVKFLPLPNLPTKITSDSAVIYNLKIKNFNAPNLYTTNVPILCFSYNVMKYKDGVFISLDSNCANLPQPNYPTEGLKVIKFKPGQTIIIPLAFPLCNMGNGKYKIKFSFTYFKGNKPIIVESEWHEYIRS